MSNMQNKYALITGATSGIGYELAKLFAKDHYNLIIVSRNQAELEQKANELSSQYGVEVMPIAKDLFKREAAFELYEEVNQRGVQVDVLVNDAGQGQFGEFKDTDINRELDIIQLNISSLVVLTKCFLKDMVARNEGKILQLASIASKVPGPWQSVYHGTKAFVLSFTEAIRTELKDTNITVTALLPGATDTDFFNKAEMQDSKIVQAGGLSDPADVAKDGYEALMNNDDKVISGFKNKVQIGMSNMMPDSAVASMMDKQQGPVDEK
ncbi:SDR family NAD(P)-dependent oxidoreductase [Mucilaginibacter sp. KACC 22063]|uniref:SDR family NAD(P)-dependent oxidoreductase n=1 Tax=Mucilaginibacter sp. KACC 22063 TaxID=3025666 RepID=UPI002367265C|nr:SDR family oxidoreductase [Mucilaginibacter sp. KACC 22063]WDF56257.1 SDR family oxidoreductase [Mucilaginibacter sp. KACC 22063]